MDYSNIVHAPLDYKFDRELFIKEYDKFIYPESRHITNNMMTWENTRELNKTWGMVDPTLYDMCDVEIDFDKVVERGIKQWKMLQLMYMVTTNDDHHLVRQHASNGGTFMRNLNLDRDWFIKDKFKHLNIANFIFNRLPFKKIVSIHCVSIDPGCFASIHRDARWHADVGRPDVIDKNGVRRQGHVLIVLNISDGGVPLYWALDGSNTNNVIKSNEDVYITSDYFLHGVPVCKSRRRQIRITGIPTNALAKHIVNDQKIIIPNDYVFDSKDRRYPG